MGLPLTHYSVRVIISVRSTLVRQQGQLSRAGDGPIVIS
jgi:hypothetical protein